MIKQEKVNHKTYGFKFLQNRFFKIKQKSLNGLEFYNKSYWKNVSGYRVKPFTRWNKSCNAYYIRYDAKFLLGLNLEKKLAKSVIQEIQIFLKSNIQLDCCDSNFSSAFSNVSCFLGFSLKLFFLKFNTKSYNNVRFNKIKANLQRRKIAESEKYLKLVEQISSKIHRQLIKSVSTTGQTIFEKLKFKSLVHYNLKIKVLKALKLSLYQMESEAGLSNATFSGFKVDGNSHIMIIASERQKENALVDTIKKWVHKAKDLVKKKNTAELETLVGCYLSPKLLKIRNSYLVELDKASLYSWSVERQASDVR